MEIFKYYIERCYPHIMSLIVVFVLYKMGINFINNTNFNSALDSVNTIAALIIGFLGAILPVILGMKNESKFVKYVFEKDERKLFLKYIKITISVGLTLVFITVVLYFKEEITNLKIKNVLFYLWTYLGISFLLCTYRSLSNMLNLIFTDDNALKNKLYNNVQYTNKSEAEKNIEEKYKL
ncbi:hypothetical protein [Diplocloster agilis]|uniref:Uncharacterized protein n=1 Tax=Diplocloster agilis TaxID=2850323 RepID=A0A949K234_9FIRM|nr:hypothetical protein [Diplocloster agilis]MBU9738551.1 hypothetical protein [Diplocloster agilis]MBU9747085.1 hypothetical protein [Diplocloster agilis]